MTEREIKSKIRDAAEKEEYQNYHGRMSDDWLKDLEKFDTNHIKPFLEIAPWIIVVFKQTYGLKDGEKELHYYVNESVGLACGMLLTAIHNAGLVALTHTPSPMKFLLVRFRKSHFFCLSSDFLRQTVMFQISPVSQPKKWSNFTDSKTKSD